MCLRMSVGDLNYRITFDEATPADIDESHLSLNSKPQKPVEALEKDDDVS